MVHILRPWNAIFRWDPRRGNCSQPTWGEVFLRAVVKTRSKPDGHSYSPLSSRTKLSSSAIRFRNRVFSSTEGSSLPFHLNQFCKASDAVYCSPQGGIVYLVDAKTSLPDICISYVTASRDI